MTITTDSPFYQKAFEQYLRKGTPIEISLKMLTRTETRENHSTALYRWHTSGDVKYAQAMLRMRGVFSTGTLLLPLATRGRNRDVGVWRSQWKLMLHPLSCWRYFQGWELYARLGYVWVPLSSDVLGVGAIRLGKLSLRQ